MKVFKAFIACVAASVQVAYLWVRLQFEKSRTNIHYDYLATVLILAAPIVVLEGFFIYGMNAAIISYVLVIILAGVFCLIQVKHTPDKHYLQSGRLTQKNPDGGYSINMEDIHEITEKLGYIEDLIETQQISWKD